MIKRAVTNVAASVHDRLVNQSRATGETFDFLLQRYAAERFLYRLGRSAYRNQYVLKGAMLFALWGGAVYRPTRDLDFAGFGSSKADDVIAAFRAICATRVDDDGLAFDAATLTAKPIRDESEYQGVRVRFRARLGTARIGMQIDVGFGNAIEPPPHDVQYPTLLDAPAASIRAYPPEAVVAEKLHVLVVQGERTSRMKDLYDLYTLASQFRFDGATLARAVAATFERRKTNIDGALRAALTPRFFSDAARGGQWRAYLDRNHLPGTSGDLAQVGERITDFLIPAWTALGAGATFRGIWRPGGPWEGVAVSVAKNIESTADLRRFKPHSSYKDSGIEWLGKVPLHWGVFRLSELTTLLNGYPFDSQYFVRGEGTPLVRIRDLNASETEVNYVGPIIENAWIEPGDVIIGMDGDFNVTRWRGQRALLNQRMCCLRPRNGANAGFVAYSLPLPLKVINDVTYSTTVKHLSSSDVRKIWLGAPTEAEQRAIAAFLDRETVRIDALVAKKERLLDLLHEKRTALITRAVTKGLDANVPMKDSGVKWIGEIPAHWEVNTTKFAARLRSGHTPSRQHPEYWQDCTIPWFGLADVWQIRDGRTEYVFQTAEKISELGLANSAARLLPKGTVILSRTASVGFSAIMGVDMATTQDFVNWVCGPSLRPEYLLYVFRSMRHEFRRLTMGSTHQTIYLPDVGQFSAPIPPVSEQDSIVDFIRAHLRRIDALVDRSLEAIKRLQELRTALISAAVTGKIDVREEAA